MEKSEGYIQWEICKYLESEGVGFHSVPNESGGRSLQEQQRLVGMGLRKGVADMVVWWPDGIGYLEVKTPAGRQSREQRRFEEDCREYGVPYELARSVDDVRAMLIMHRGGGICSR